MNSEKMIKASRSFELVVSHQITRAQLISALDAMLGKFGCPSCGLNGHGITFNPGDPDPIMTSTIREISQIENVLNVNTFTQSANLGQLVH